ncbi:Bug family tripartite tricarboxylate transporter substrate binding protein [Inquilinus sp. OTU3971]|uniref:Bug family tripartite tricarboxylate transporter substrate binding protein n=1 Tax=Inquilinus sp. OTU3971 TaxID=3043855 RepID=UPI00313F001B
MSKTALALCACLAAALLPVTGASAQDAAAGYPAKPVTIIVPFAAGGNTDLFGRLLADEMSKTFGQTFIVENKPGAGGAIGAELLAKAQPDGYTLGMATVSTHAINPWVYKDLAYDPVKDFAPVSLAATLPNLLVVNPSFPAKSVPELIALLKAEPEGHSYASSGFGTSIHLAAAAFEQQIGARMTHVPYKGSAQALSDVVAGHVEMIFDNIPTAVEQAKAGAVRPLAVTGLQRAAVLPDVPTMAEFLPGFDITSWQGLLAPAGTPPAIVEKLSAEAQRIMRLPEIRAKVEALGAQPIGSTAEEFAAYIKAETAKYKPIVEASGATAQ